MQFVKWEEKYSVGIDEIDQQHQELFRILNEMFGFFGKASKEELNLTLSNMMDYAAFHFETEEPYYQAHPDFEKHRHEHDIFNNKTATFRDTLKESATQDIDQNVLNFLLAWLQKHILETDIKFFNDMKKMGK